MLATPQITATPAQLTACVHLSVPATEIQLVMGPGIMEVFAALAAQNITPAGPWFTHHSRRPTDTFDFDICVPVSEPVTPVGRVKPGELPAARLAQVVYSGPYEGLAVAWGEFCDWIAAAKLTPAEELWERYLVGPESSPDPANWRTELNRPLLGADVLGERCP